MKKRTLVLGASSNPERYSFKAMKSLYKLNIPFVGIGRKEVETDDFKIISGKPENIGEIHTITLYLNAENQKEYYKYILSLTPRRIIFNPGTENNELADIASREGIEVIEACTLVMLCTGVY